ncbi:MinD/ParA family protein [Amycolatopsis sp. cmx-4-54]|uniref:MinD/ParA family ATP-binding protein n=1 Tax=Amycolatopsis sp. cmx-4-54 TaxID=2790936 RepID=UPI00397E8230
MRPGDASEYGAEEPVDLTRMGSTPRPPHAPSEAPEPRALDSASLAAAPPVTADPATWGWRGRLRRATFGVIKPKPGHTEIRYRLAEVAVRQYIGGARLIMVANPKGGSRKTTTALMLGHVFAALRGGSTVVWDNNEARGTLAERAEVATPATTVTHLLGAFERLIGPAGSAGDMSHYLRTQPSRAEILAADAEATRRSQIGSAETGRVGLLLSRYYRLTVMDTGTNPRSGAWQWAAHQADVLVVPITCEPDVVQLAAWMLDTLSAIGRADLATTAVTVINPSTTAPDPQVRSRVLEYFSARTAVVVEVPFDPQLAGGAPVVFDRISQASRRAWVAAAAAVADQLAARVSTRPDQMPTSPGTGRHKQGSAQRPADTQDSTEPRGADASVTELPARRAKAQ